QFLNGPKPAIYNGSPILVINKIFICYQSPSHTFRRRCRKNIRFLYSSLYNVNLAATISYKKSIPELQSFKVIYRNAILRGDVYFAVVLIEIINPFSIWRNCLFFKYINYFQNIFLTIFYDFYQSIFVPNNQQSKRFTVMHRCYEIAGKSIYS